MKIVTLVTLGLLLLLTACVPNVTTGYRWAFAIPVNADYLKVVKTNYEEPQNDLVDTGAPSGYRWYSGMDL